MTWNLGNKAEEDPEEESLGLNSPQCREKRTGANCDLGVTVRRGSQISDLECGVERVWRTNVCGGEDSE